MLGGAIVLIAMSMRPIITSIGPLLDVLKQSLHLSNAAVTSLTAVPIIAMGLFASLAPWMERTFGMKRSIQVLLLLLLGASAVRYVAFGWTELLVTSLVGGIAIAVLGPLLSSYVRTYYEKQFDRMIGWYSFGVGFGAMLSASATPALYEWGGLPFALAIWAVIPFAALISWQLGQPVGKREVAHDDVSSNGRSPWHSKEAWLYLLFFGVQSAIFFTVMTWFIPLLTKQGYSLIEAGSWMTLLTATQIVCNLMYPSFAASLPNRVIGTYVVLSMSLVGFALLLVENVYATGGGTMLLGLSLGALFPIALTYPLETTTVGEANEWTAMMQTGGFVLAGIAPVVVGWSVDVVGSDRFIYPLLMAGTVVLVGIVWKIDQLRLQLEKVG